MDFNKNKQKLFLIFGVTVLLVITIGASYAYISNVVNNYSTSSVSASVASPSGVVTLSKTNRNLALNLSTSDLRSNSRFISNETIATASVTGNGSYNCDYTLSITKSASSTDNDLYLAYQSNQGGGIPISLWINNTKYSFSTPNLFDNLQYSGKLYDVSNGNSKSIDAAFVVDLSSLNSKNNVIAGKDITINISVTSFECTLGGDGGRKILADNNLKRNLSSNRLKDGIEIHCDTPDYSNDFGGGVSLICDEQTNNMYRYVGDYETVNNNYLCFGTSNKSECLSNKNEYLYRILGIKTDGTLKVISSYGSAANWTDSSGYPFGIRKYDFLNFPFDFSDHWYAMIPNQLWVSRYVSASAKNSYDANTVYYNESYIDLEYGDSNYETYISKFGWMYMYDYYYANGWYDNNTGNYDSNGWIHGSHNLGYASNWLMSRYTSNKSYVVSGTGGNVTALANDGVAGDRYVFYISKTVRLIGSGTISDPYIIIN